MHGLLINIVHSLYTTLVTQDNKLQSLRLLLSELNQACCPHIGHLPGRRPVAQVGHLTLLASFFPVCLCAGVGAMISPRLECCSGWVVRRFQRSASRKKSATAVELRHSPWEQLKQWQ